MFCTLACPYAGGLVGACPLTTPSRNRLLVPLQELTLAGNRITTLPAKVAQFKSLKRLQVAGNLIAALPPEITQLTKLEVRQITSEQGM